MKRLNAHDCNMATSIEKGKCVEMQLWYEIETIQKKKWLNVQLYTIVMHSFVGVSSCNRTYTLPKIRLRIDVVFYLINQCILYHLPYIVGRIPKDVLIQTKILNVDNIF